MSEANLHVYEANDIECLKPMNSLLLTNSKHKARCL